MIREHFLRFFHVDSTRLDVRAGTDNLKVSISWKSSCLNLNFTSDRWKRHRTFYNSVDNEVSYVSNSTTTNRNTPLRPPGKLHFSTDAARRLRLPPPPPQPSAIHPQAIPHKGKERKCHRWITCQKNSSVVTKQISDEILIIHLITSQWTHSRLARRNVNLINIRSD